MIKWTHPEVMGLIPLWITAENPKDAVTQIHENYSHGGGWNDFEGFELKEQGGRFFLKYPQDPPMLELSRGYLRDETIVMFRSAWVAVIQLDGSFRVARID